MSLTVRCMLCKEILRCSHNDKLVLIDHVRHKHPNIQVIRLSDQLETGDLPKEVPSKKSLSLTKNGRKMSSNGQPLAAAAAAAAVTEQPAGRASLADPQTKPPANDPQIDANIRNIARDVFSSNFVQCDCPTRRKSRPGASSPSNESLIRTYLAKCKDADRYTRNAWPLRSALFGGADADAEPAAADADLRPKAGKSHRTTIEAWRPGGGAKVECTNCGRKAVPQVRCESARSARTRFGSACVLALWPLCFMPCLFPAPRTEYAHCSRCGWRLGRYDARTGRISVGNDGGGGEEWKNVKEEAAAE